MQGKRVVPRVLCKPHTLFFVPTFDLRGPNHWLRLLFSRKPTDPVIHKAIRSLGSVFCLPKRIWTRIKPDQSLVWENSWDSLIFQGSAPFVAFFWKPEISMELMGMSQTKKKNISSWWLNQHNWKRCSSKWVHLPQISGENSKNIFQNHHLDLENQNTFHFFSENVGKITCFSQWRVGVIYPHSFWPHS